MILPQQPSGRGVSWRPLTKVEARGNWCCAVGLTNGDCKLGRTAGVRYCYYHDKVQRGLIESIMDERSELVLGDVPLIKLRQGARLVYACRDNEGHIVVPEGALLTAGQVRQVRAFTQADTVLVQYARKAWIAIPPQTRYPVWPLPVTGYVLLEQEAAA